MFDVGFAELITIFVIALIVLGPERLPEVARTAGRWLGRARQMARSMQLELERELDVNNIAGDTTPNAETPTPKYAHLPERTGASYDDDPEDLDEDFHAHDEGDDHADEQDDAATQDADAAEIEKARG